MIHLYSIILAASDKADSGTSMMFAQWVFNALFAIGMAWVAGKLRKIESQEGELKARSNEVIDQRFATLNAELQGCLKVLGKELAGQERRLENGDELFEKLRERDEQQRFEMTQRLDVIKEYVRENCVSEKQFLDLRLQVQETFRKISEQIDQLTRRKS